jgi:hypothetical protein
MEHSFETSHYNLNRSVDGGKSLALRVNKSLENLTTHIKLLKEKKEKKAI